MARRPHPGQAVLLCRRGGRTGRRPPGRSVRGRHRRGPGHPRRSSRHRDGWGMASRHRRRCFSGMHRRRRADRGGTAGTGPDCAQGGRRCGNTPRPRSCDAGCEDPRADQGTRDSRRGQGISCTTSAGFLSRRRPWNLGWRSRPSAVHSVKPTWATSRGSTQCTPDPGRPRTGSKGGSGRSRAARAACRLIRVRWSKPVPTLPANGG